MKYSAHIVMIIAAAICGTLIAFQLFRSTFPLSDQMSAKVPASVGNKAAPIPVLKVENVVLGSKADISSVQAQRAINSSVPGKRILPKYALNQYQMQWKVSVEDGSMQPVMAQVYVPVVSQDGNGQSFPIIVYGPGSTGLADRCAPSREDLARGNMGNYRNYMISEASQGYIVVMPNYEGFDNANRSQHYFNKDNEARTMLGAAKALEIAADSVTLPANTNALFFGGYSQGGHAAFAAADYSDTYTPGMKIAGIFGHGPTTDITEYLKSNPNLAAYFFASYSEYYPVIDNKKILTPTWIGYLERAKQICVDEGFGINSTTVGAVFADPFEKALVGNTLDKDFPEVNKVFEENDAGTSFVGIPSMIVQGKVDVVVTDKNQNIFVDSLCKRGVPVDLKEYAGLNHFDTRQRSFFDTNTWIDAVSQGKTVNDSCVGRIL